MGALYKVRLFDSSGNLLAVLENSTGEQEHRRFNQAGDIQFSLPATDPKAKFLALATRFEIWRRGQRISSGTITRRDVSGDPWTLFGLTNETLLAGIQTPGNVEINGGVSLLSDSADLAHIFEALTYDYKVLSLNRSFDTSYVAGLTDTGTISFELEDQVALKLDAENTYPAVNLGDTAGCVCFQFSIPEGYELFRLRWQQQVAETNQIVFRYRTSVNGGNSWTVWSSWIGHGDSQETSAAQGYPLVHPVGTDTVQIQFQLLNSDTETVTEGYDDAGEPIVIYGSTPILEAIELVCRQEAALRKVVPHDTDWPSEATVDVTDVQLHYHNGLQAMVEIAEKFGYEFYVDDDCRLHLGKQLGVDRSNEIIFRASHNMNIVQLEDNRQGMCNILTCLGAGDGLDQLKATVTNDESIREYGPHPDKQEWKDVETLAELESKGREVVGMSLADPGERGAPKQTFRIQGIVKDDLPAFYLGDTVRIVIPKDGVNTTGRILEVVRGPSDKGDAVDIMINRTRASVVDRIVQAIERIPIAKPPEARKPARPTNVRATGEYRRIVVQWQARAGVLSRVYHSVSKDGPYAMAYQGPDRKWVHEPVEIGETHHYKVAVVVDGIESDLVGPVRATVPGVPTGDFDRTPPGNVVLNTCEFLKEIVLRWFPVAGAVAYEIRGSNSGWGESAGLIWRGHATELHLTPTARSHTYYIRAISAAGVYSAEATMITVTNATPGTPPQPAVTEFFSCLLINIQPVPDNDIVSYKLYVTPVDDGGNPIGSTETTTYMNAGRVTYNASPGSRFKVEVAASDVLGEGAKSTPVYARTRKIEGVADFAQELIPPRIVNELPALPDPEYPEGSLVVLTTNHVLYRCTGDSWDASVNVDMIVGQIQAGMIAAGAIGAEEIASKAILADHFAAGSIEAYFLTVQEAFIDDAHILNVEADKITTSRAKIQAAQIESIEAQQITVGGSAPGISLTKPDGAHLWHFDGSLVSTDGTAPEPGAVATLRPDGRFGGCVAVEEGTTNLYSNPFFQNGTDGWSSYNWSGGGKIYVEAMKTPVGNSAMIMDNAGATAELALIQYVALPDAVSNYTVSLLVKNLSSQPCTVQLYMGNGYYTVGTVNPGDGWVRLTRTYVAGEYKQSAYHHFKIYTDRKIAIAAIQLEQKPFATSFVDGTRAAGVLKYDPSILNKPHGTIAVWFKLHNLNARYNALITTSTASSPGPRLLIMREVEGSGANKLRVWDGDGSTEGILTSTTVLQKDVWYHFAFTWSPSGRRLYINGFLEASNARSGPIGGSELRIGYWYHVGGSDLLNGLIDELLILPYAATPEQIAAWYAMGAPFVDPQGIVDGASTPVHVDGAGGTLHIDSQGETWIRKSDGKVMFNFDANTGDAEYAGKLGAKIIEAQHFKQVPVTDTYNVMDSFDSSHPLEIPIYIDEAMTIHDVRITARGMRYRAYASGASAGGSHSHDVEIEDHTHTIPFAIVSVESQTAGIAVSVSDHSSHSHSYDKVSSETANALADLTWSTSTHRHSFSDSDTVYVSVSGSTDQVGGTGWYHGHSVTASGSGSASISGDTGDSSTAYVHNLSQGYHKHGISTAPANTSSGGPTTHVVTMIPLNGVHKHIVPLSLPLSATESGGAQIQTSTAADSHTHSLVYGIFDDTSANGLPRGVDLYLSNSESRSNYVKVADLPEPPSGVDEFQLCKELVLPVSLLERGWKWVKFTTTTKGRVSAHIVIRGFQDSWEQ